MMSIKMLRKTLQNHDIFMQKCDFFSNFNVMWNIESKILPPALLNLFNLWKRDKMLSKPCILSVFLNLFNPFNKTWALV